MNEVTRDSVKELIRQLPENMFSFDDLRKSVSGDYESLKDVIFALLNEEHPNLIQVFDKEAQTMKFVWRQP